MKLDTFQKAFGNKLGKLLQLPELTAALILLRAQRRDYILGLTDEDIQERAQSILGDIRGQFRFENDLMTLSEKREFKLPDESVMQYVSPEEEATAWEAIDKYREQQQKKKAA